MDRVDGWVKGKRVRTSSFMRPLKMQWESPETMLHWYMLLCPPLRLPYMLNTRQKEDGCGSVRVTPPYTHKPPTHKYNDPTHRWWMKEWMSSSCSSLVTVRPSVCFFPHVLRAC